MIKKLLPTLITCLIVCSYSYAQNFTTKYGKVTKDELEMNSYTPDTSANAVVLYKNRTVRYDYIVDEFQINYNYENKIKILNSDGTDQANVSILFYSPESSSEGPRDVVTRLEAYAYNLEAGKIVKTKMEKSYIFEERISPYYEQIKFAIPTVKAGTVIEYRYQVTTKRFFQLDSWNIQQDIPVVYAYCEMSIPEYYKFNLNTQGYEPVKVDDGTESQTFNIAVGNGETVAIQSTNRKLKFESRDVPAIKDDKHVWCVNDYTSLITFELQGIQMPHSIYKSYTKTWKDIDDMLRKGDYFGGYLNIRNPYKDDMPTLGLDTMSNDQKIKTIFRFLKSKISWNGKYSIAGSNMRQAIKTGTGYNSDFNFVLMSMLKEAGIKTSPILLRRRNNGRLPYTHPSINMLNTFVVGAHNTDSTMIYVDGSILYGDIGTLPTSLMVDRARSYNYPAEGQWVDLSRSSKNVVNMVTFAHIDEKGAIKGNRSDYMTGVFAAEHKRKFFDTNDSAKFVADRQSWVGGTIEKYEPGNMNKLSSEIQEKFEFSKTAMTSNDRIYFNPMIFQHIYNNEFTEQERKLPIEFAHPYELYYTTSVKIPDDYEVEEIPKSMRFSMEDGGIQCRYMISASGGIINVRYAIIFNRIIYPSLEYSTLKTFWEMMLQKNKEQVVLKKKSA